MGILRITKIFGLSKGLTCIHLEMISKVFIILFLLCLWGYRTKTNQKVFFSNKCHVYSLLDQNEGKSKVFFERGREG